MTDTANAKPETCVEYSRGSRWVVSSACGKPAKGHDDKGRALCGVHLGGWKRSQAAKAKSVAEEQSSRTRWEKAEAVGMELSAQLGVTLKVETMTISGWRVLPNGRYSLSEADLRAIIERLRK